MSAVDRITSARAELDKARNALKKEAKQAIREALDDVFKDEAIQNVGWSSKCSEYNDEGMYPGVHGPIINVPEEEYSRELMGYDDAPGDKRLAALKSVLDNIGEEILSEIFGDEHVVVVSRKANISLDPLSVYEIQSSFGGY